MVPDPAKTTSLGLEYFVQRGRRALERGRTKSSIELGRREIEPYSVSRSTADEVVDGGGGSYAQGLPGL